MVQNPFHGALPWKQKMKFGPRRLKHIDSDNLGCFDAYHAFNVPFWKTWSDHVTWSQAQDKSTHSISMPKG
jgi:hypothetical protein